MAKAHSPLRLEADLVEQARITGKQLHRSTAEQIEYWADIGRNVAKVITPETLLQVYSGLARVKVEPVAGPTVDPEAVFHALEEDRECGNLKDNITSSSLRYQASVQHPGLLEQIALDGTVTLGRFKNGEFQPV
ncbi:TA system antitoxin ParD family protein [Amphritea sp. HPY]|uniref:TA system antitoxin ParD family protein n=1 Tax=Amphritea sp. HPY TaxID=3421652 RepID=UPI003D7EAC98